MHALITASIFSGAAIYINFVEQPARFNLENSALLAAWKPAYRKGFTLQSALAFISGMLGIIGYLQSHNYLWLMGAGIILLNWPYTFIFIRPIVQKLLKTDIHLANQVTRNMITQWGTLHAVRSALGILAVMIFAFAL